MECREFSGHLRHRIPEKLLRSYAARACRLYGAPILTVDVQAERGYRASYNMLDFHIRLDPVQGCNLLTLAHEIAHHLTWVRSPRAHDHGPIWLRHYAHLVDTFRLMPAKALLIAARKYNLTAASF